MARKYILKKSIPRKGFPTASKYYKEAHAQADNAEKKTYPKGYEALKKIDKDLPLNKLIGKNTKKGKIEVSKLVPKKYRAEVALHESVENNALNRKLHFKNCQCPVCVKKRTKK